jgi:hypothetical protein
MEDILASIRRILNDDDQAKPGPSVRPAEPLALSPEMIVPRPAERPAAPPPEPPAASEGRTEPRPAAEPLAEPGTVAAAAATIEQLVRHARPRPTEVSRGGGVTLEDLVQEALRPVLKEWLDANLPALVERVVRAEIDRLVARGGP